MGIDNLINRLLAILAALGMTAGLPVVAAAAEQADAGAATYIPIFFDELADEYVDWSWAKVDLANQSPVWGGAVSIRVQLGPWEAMYLRSESPRQTVGKDILSFAVHGGNGSALPIWIVVLDQNGEPGPGVEITPVPGDWTAHDVTLAELGNPTSIGGLWFQNATDQDRPPIYIDNVGVDLHSGTQSGGFPADTTGNYPVDNPAGPIIEPSPRLDPVNRGPAFVGDVLRIDLDPGATLDRSTTDPYTRETSVHTVGFPHSINDDIYGMNFAPASLLEELQIGVHRWGGNSAERYNHTNDASVIGTDWYFMSFTDDADADHQFERTNNESGTSTHLQVPIGGWVTRDNVARCGFAVLTPDGVGSSAAWQDDVQPHFDNPALECGSGTHNGERLAADPSRTSVPVDESFVAGWVTELVAAHGTAAAGGVESYALGNEPNLWADTHRDLFDGPLERQEIIARNQTYAAAIKQADPTAAVYGPVLWGGTSFFGTSAEFDRAEYPGSNETFVAEYLAEMQTASTAAGVRLLDGLDIHFYDGRTYPTGPADQRVEATRSLWDSSYIPVDWWALNVGDDTDPGRVESIGLIPRMRTLIDQNYPGTDLAITEYNFGSLDTIDGAIAQADALGIFGREGVDRAMLWDPLDPPNTPGETKYVNRPGMWAFRMFRNADGSGESFGDQAIFAESYDEADLSIYAARRSADGAVTLMIINKTDAAISTQVDLDGLVGWATTYRYDESDLGGIQNLGQTEIAGSVAGDFAAMSISLIVITAG